MSPKSFIGTALVLASALTVLGCQALSPASPSPLTSSRDGVVRPFDDAPAPPAAPAPVTTMINIVGTEGVTAFLPNPIQAAMGNLVVWMNGDSRLHHIVLEDGTDIGDVMPGQATAPVALKTAAPVGYRCTLHPSMVGMINGELAAPAPEPPPYYPPYNPDPYDPY